MFVVLRKNIFLIAVVILFLYAAFIAGTIFRAHFALEQPPITVEKISQQEYAHTSAKDTEMQGQVEDAQQAAGTPGGSTEGAAKTSTLPKDTYFIASINGEAYYLPWCGGASRIKESNKITFASPQDAEAKGYRPAANCPEIELFKKNGQ